METPKSTNNIVSKVLTLRIIEIAPSSDRGGEKCGEKEKEAKKASYLLTYWRRREDSNFRSRFCPDAPLAGECLRPLGHVSVSLH